MPDRPTLGPGSGTISGTAFFTEYSVTQKGLWDASALPLTDVGGGGDVVTASIAWPLQAGLVDGMKFTLTWANTNSGATTLNIDGVGAKPVRKPDGSTLIAGDAEAGTRALIEYIGGSFVILSDSGSGGGGALRYFWQFTASGTWTKPSGLADDTMVHVVVFGAGGGGGRGADGAGGNNAGSGGGGGGMAYGVFRAADLPASVSVTVGAGGAAASANNTGGSSGGASSFGSLLTAGGGGGGTWTNTASAQINGGTAGRGEAPAAVYGDADSGGSGGGAKAGASGGIGGTSNAGSDASRGGGGGGGANAGNSPSSKDGGVSGLAGNGGKGNHEGAADAGVAPSGGGGGSGAGNAAGAGARGEVRIWI